jgi:hypothetical protein
MGTHQLESADRRTSEDTEGRRASEGHSRTGESRQTKKGRDGKKASERTIGSWHKTQEIDAPISMDGLTVS